VYLAIFVVYLAIFVVYLAIFVVYLAKPFFRLTAICVVYLAIFVLFLAKPYLNLRFNYRLNENYLQRLWARIQAPQWITIGKFSTINKLETLLDCGLVSRFKMSVGGCFEIWMVSTLNIWRVTKILQEASKFVKARSSLSVKCMDGESIFWVAAVYPSVTVGLDTWVVVVNG